KYLPPGYRFGPGRTRSLHRESVPGSWSETGLSAEGGGRAGESAADPGSRGIAGRQAAGVLGAHASLCDGHSRRETAAAHHRECQRISAVMVAGWEMDRLRDMVGRRRGNLEGARNGRHCETAHANVSILQRSRMVAA